MGLLNLLKAAPKSVPPTIEQSVAEAASALLNKQQKISLADQAAMTGHMAQIGQTELARVDKLYAKHGLGVKGTQDDMDIIVCDDYHRNDPQPTRIWPVVAALLAGSGLGIGGILGAMAILKGGPQETPPAQVQKIENTAGFLIDLIPPK